jgi:hypothetical protein
MTVLTAAAALIATFPGIGATQVNGDQALGTFRSFLERVGVEGPHRVQAIQRQGEGDASQWFIRMTTPHHEYSGWLRAKDGRVSRASVSRTPSEGRHALPQSTEDPDLAAMANRFVEAAEPQEAIRLVRLIADRDRGEATAIFGIFHNGLPLWSASHRYLLSFIPSEKRVTSFSGSMPLPEFGRSEPSIDLESVAERVRAEAAELARQAPLSHRRIHMQDRRPAEVQWDGNLELGYFALSERSGVAVLAFRALVLFKYVDPLRGRTESPLPIYIDAGTGGRLIPSSPLPF